LYHDQPDREHHGRHGQRILRLKSSELRDTGGHRGLIVAVTHLGGFGEFHIDYDHEHQ
jgi:hypothetical protein